MQLQGQGASSLTVLALLQYVQVLPRPGRLPDPTGPLSSTLPSSAIKETNAAVSSIREAGEEPPNGKRGHYHKLSDRMLAAIWKYAVINNTY